MRERIEQHGVFHVVTKTRQDLPGLTTEGVPQIIVDNLLMTTYLQQAHLYAFCILPNHFHILLKPGHKGLSEYMRSLKTCSSFHIGKVFHRSVGPWTDTAKSVLWERGFYDERVQSFAQYQEVKRYIEYNALKHGYVKNPLLWKWSSLVQRNIVVFCEEW